MSGHRAPWRSAERTAYFNNLMDNYARQSPDNRFLPFTPPTTRGSLITRAESWIINNQRAFVPTLVDAGCWPVVEHDASPDALSRDQAAWLSMPGRWGEGAALWACKGWRAVDVSPIVVVKSDPEKPDPIKVNRAYRQLVLDGFDDAQRAERRQHRDRKAQVEQAARDRL